MRLAAGQSRTRRWDCLAVRTAAAVAILVAIGASVPGHARSAPTSCFPPGSNTISETATARVFAMPGSSSGNPGIYGCLYRVSRPFRLVRPFEVEFGVDFQEIVIADPYVGFGFALSEAADGASGSIRVLDLRNGRRKHDESAASHFFADVENLVLTAAGSVA